MSNRKKRKIFVNTELVSVVQKLIKCGIDVRYTSCDINTRCLGLPAAQKLTQIQIEFGREYPDDMFEGLPSEWIKYEFRITNKNDYIMCSGISYSHQHPIQETDDNIAFANSMVINALESWLDTIDPDGFKAVWTLAGVL
jgi:hypothetical protein